MQKVLVLSLISVLSFNIFAMDSAAAGAGETGGNTAATSNNLYAAGADAPTIPSISSNGDNGAKKNNNSGSAFFKGAFFAGLIARSIMVSAEHYKTSKETRALIVDAQARKVEITTENKHLYEAELSLYHKYNQINAATHILVGATALAAVLVGNEKFQSVASKSVDALGAFDIAELVAAIYVNIPEMLNFNPGKIQLNTAKE